LQEDGLDPLLLFQCPQWVEPGPKPLVSETGGLRTFTEVRTACAVVREIPGLETSLIKHSLVPTERLGPLSEPFAYQLAMLAVPRTPNVCNGVGSKP